MNLIDLAIVGVLAISVIFGLYKGCLLYTSRCV